MHKLRKILLNFVYFGLLILTGAHACSPYSPTPFPLPPASNLPNDTFLFVHVYDDTYTCLDGLCRCPVSESPSMPFGFRGRTLRLNEYFFDPVPQDWGRLRSSTDLLILNSDWSRSTAHLQAFASFPIKTPVGGFRILGVNQRGDIQIMAKRKYLIVPVGSEYTKEQKELISKDCKVLHKYTLYNYGLIQDEDVEFTGGNCCEP